MGKLIMNPDVPVGPSFQKIIVKEANGFDQEIDCGFAFGMKKAGPGVKVDLMFVGPDDVPPPQLLFAMLNLMDEPLGMLDHYLAEKGFARIPLNG